MTQIHWFDVEIDARHFAAHMRQQGATVRIGMQDATGRWWVSWS
jgi:hypothetical protein